MKRILFVDDEPNVLSGLRRMLRLMRDQWDMQFATSGPEALALAQNKPGFDVIVSDMRMPGMDGAKLLEEIRRVSPQTVRLVLSGQSDEELTMKAVGPAHQFLSKPCEADTLINVIQRACALREGRVAGGLAKLVAQLDKLPSMPGIYRRLVAELQSPEAGVDTIGSLIAQDPAMTSKILKLVNSSFFALKRTVTDPTQAAMILGISTIKSLVLSAHIFGQMSAHVPEELHLPALHIHSLAAAVCARRLMELQQGGKARAEEAFVAGLLHDVGRLAIAANLADDYQEAVLLAQRENVALVAAERQVLGACHAEVGAYLLGLWGLPDAVVQAVGSHHEPAAADPDEFTVLVCVHVANVLEHERHSQAPAGKPAALDRELLERLDLWRCLADWRAARDGALGEAVAS